MNNGRNNGNGEGSQSFPHSRRISHSADLPVPQREITLSGDNVPLCVYETAGPQGQDVGTGLAPLRAPWTARRRAAAGGNLSQMHWARRGEITEEMRFRGHPRERRSRSS